MEKEFVPYESAVKLMEKQFVPYKLAIKLKELGFDEECISFYNESGRLNLSRIESFDWVIKNSNSQVIKLKSVAAPLWQQAFDWFREQYSLFGAAQYDHIKNALSYYIVWGRMGGYCNVEWDYLTYQEARQACLEKLIELIPPKA